MQKPRKDICPFPQGQCVPGDCHASPPKKKEREKTAERATFVPASFFGHLQRCRKVTPYRGDGHGAAGARWTERRRLDFCVSAARQDEQLGWDPGTGIDLGEAGIGCPAHLEDDAASRQAWQSLVSASRERTETGGRPQVDA